jgi:hypothetical protein
MPLSDMVMNFLYRGLTLENALHTSTRSAAGGRTLKTLDVCKTYGRSTNDAFKSIICNISNGKSLTLKKLVLSNIIVRGDGGDTSQMVEFIFPLPCSAGIGKLEGPRIFHHAVVSGDQGNL